MADSIGSSLGNASNDALFQILIATAVDGIMVIDRRGTVQIYNNACERLFQYKPEEVLGQNVKMLMPAPYQDEHDGYLERYKATGERRIIGIGREVLGQRKDGSNFPMYLSVGEGFIAGQQIFVGIIHDLSDIRARDRRLQELQGELVHATRLTAMGQLSSALAHELNQPLSAILNYTNAARRNLSRVSSPEAAKASEALEKAAGQTARAGQIIRRLRDFVEKREPNRALEDMNNVAEDAIALGLVGATYANIKLKTNFGTRLPQVFVDKVQIQQVMINLMRNAVEAMAGSIKRELTITTALTSDDLIEVAIADTGPGIPDGISERLFEPFITTKAKGMGVGLTICRSIIEAHHGRLWMTPNPGGGTIFRFRVPNAASMRDEDAG